MKKAEFLKEDNCRRDFLKLMALGASSIGT